MIALRNTVALRMRAWLVGSVLGGVLILPSTARGDLGALVVAFLIWMEIECGGWCFR